MSAAGRRARAGDVVGEFEFSVGRSSTPAYGRTESAWGTGLSRGGGDLARPARCAEWQIDDDVVDAPAVAAFDDLQRMMTAATLPRTPRAGPGGYRTVVDA